MICLICGKNYINLGVHVNKKHMDCKEYKYMFNIPLTTPLAEKELCDSLSVGALKRLESTEYLDSLKKRCVENSKIAPRGKVKLPASSKKHLIEMNRKTGECYRKKMIPIIKNDYMEGMTPIAIQRKHGVSPCTLKDWQTLGLLPKRRLKYQFDD
jgi:hypothetical protein